MTELLQIINGDALAELRKLPAQSVQTCVTSPPYWGLRDYGCDGQIGLETTPEEFVAKLVDVFREVRRVLRDDGTAWVNLGDSYACSANGRSAADTRATGKDDRTFRDKPFSTVQGKVKAKDLVGQPWAVAFALRDDGWYLRADIIWAKPNPMPESVTDRPTKAHEYLFLLAKSANYYYDADAVREKTGREMSHAEYSAKTAPGAAWPSAGLTRYAGAHKHDGGQSHPNGRNRRSVWTVGTEPYPDAHFATFPPKLIEPCVLAGCPEGGTVLDPFAGTGTTGEVALKLNRRAVLIELNPEYCELIRKRVAPHMMASLFPAEE